MGGELQPAPVVLTPELRSVLSACAPQLTTAVARDDVYGNGGNRTAGTTLGSLIPYGRMENEGKRKEKMV